MSKQIPPRNHFQKAHLVIYIHFIHSMLRLTYKPNLKSSGFRNTSTLHHESTSQERVPFQHPSLKPKSAANSNPNFKSTSPHKQHQKTHSTSFTLEAITLQSTRAGLERHIHFTIRHYTPSTHNMTRDGNEGCKE